MLLRTLCILWLLPLVFGNDFPLLLVSLDGLGWQFTGGTKANTPNLDELAKNGAHAIYMETVTPTKTWPTHQTYLTGLYPENHGIVSNTFWDPVFEEKFILQYDCSNFDPKFYDAAEPIWLTAQKQGLSSAMHFWPGFYSYKEKPSLYEELTCFENCTELNMNYKDLPKYRKPNRSGWPPYIHCFANQSLPFKNRIDKLIGWMTLNRPPKFLSLYINEPDSTGHTYGIHTGDYVNAIERVDKDVVGYLVEQLKKAGLFDKVNMIIVSDHSMIETSSNRTIYLSDYIDVRTYTLTEGGVIGHLWPNAGKENEIYANLTKANIANINIYKKQDIPESFHWKHNRRVPPILLEPDLGWVVRTERPANIKPWRNAGHGWHSRKELGAIFYAHGPSFKRNYQTKQPLQAVDVYPLMCHLLGIRPLPNNGSFENMKELLVSEDPSSGAASLSMLSLFTMLFALTLCHIYD